MPFSPRNIMGILIVLHAVLLCTCCLAYSGHEDEYIQIPGLIDLRSTFSDGTHSIEELAEMADSRGFKVLFINDHDQIALSYGIPPFRNIIRYKKEYPSIMTHGPKNYLDEIERVSEKYPEMIIVPGCETSAYYYWTGSLFKKDLTVNEYDCRMIIIDFNNPEDYDSIPNLPYKFSLRYTSRLLPGTLIFIIPLIIGLILLKWKGVFRFAGIFLILLSLLGIIEYNPFRSSLFSPYQGDKGIAPFQELIDYVNEKGGMCFWNYPEQKSGTRSHGPINVKTPPYPQVLRESDGYTGFSAIYGEYTTITDPGRDWDMVLTEYCMGGRERPVWAISSADFHEDGRLNLRLGSFPTVFLVKEFTLAGILEAIKNGRMYCARGDGEIWPKIDYFNVLGEVGEEAFMGDTLITGRDPVIKFGISHNGDQSKPITIHLIRGGELLETFEGDTPMDIEYLDSTTPRGVMTYYRLMDDREHLVSNPIFVIVN